MNPPTLMAAPKPYERGRSGNLFLDSLVTNGSIHDDFTFERAEQGKFVAENGGNVGSIFFPTTGVISNVVRMEDGTTVETTLVGRDGFFGVPVVLGIEESVGDAMFQIAGDAWRLSRLRFVECLKADAELRARSSRYAYFLIGSISQFSGCNRLHPLGQRLARWLTMAHDRVGGDVIILTQEYLATMLGVKRPGVSVAAAELERDGLITYERGRIVVLNRRGLRSAACECYDTTSALLERTLGYRLSKESDD